MNKNLYKVLTFILAVCLTAGGFYLGKDSGRKEARSQQEELLQQRDELLNTNEELLRQQEELRMLNRSSAQNLIMEDGPVYVIGHKSPDSDTVCSAIAYARLLSLLGYDAEARITAPVNNETAYVLKQAGAEMPEVLYDASGMNIFLVDHSEYVQAVDGLADAHVVGVIDHHGVGTLNTGHQTYYEGRPIGSTATIVWLEYLNFGLDIDPQTAYLMLGAVLSDTSNLTGSTTTDADRKAVEVLAETAGVTDVDALYKQMHIESLSYAGMSDLEILFSDYKEYDIAGTKVGVGQISAVDTETAIALAERMKAVMPEGMASRDVDLMYASVGMRENGLKNDYLVPGNELSEEILKDAFPNYDTYNGTAYAYMTGLGRKTILIPGLTDYLNAHPHE